MNEFLLWLGMATIVISCDVEILPEQLLKLSPYIRYSATAHEALDYPEWKINFISPYALDSDLNAIRSKMNELPFYPKKEDFFDWGETLEHLQDQMRANRQFHDYLELIKECNVMWDRDYLIDTITENQKLHDAIDWLQYSQLSHQTRYNSRYSMSRVRQIIGVEAYNRRDIIPFIPYWRLHNIP